MYLGVFLSKCIRFSDYDRNKDDNHLERLTNVINDFQQKQTKLTKEAH